MKLINIRGTNSAGKTTLVRRLMALMEPVKSSAMLSVKYTVWEPGPVVIYGPYKEGVATGGVDLISRISDLPEVTAAIIPHANILMEGLIISGLQSMTSRIRDEVIKAGGSFHIISLTTPIDVCIEDTKKRRAIVNNIKPYNTENLVMKARAVHLSNEKFKMWGWEPPELLSREEAFLRCRELLEI